MKNLFKLPLLALAITLSVAGCKGHNSGSSADSAGDTSKTKMDSSTSVRSTSDTSVKVDTSKASDTSKTKVDTVSKTVTKHTETKKVVKKTE